MDNGTQEAKAGDGLLPCPFCGSRPKIGVRPDGGGHGESYDAAFVQCDCGASIKEGSYTGYRLKERSDSVVAKWNRRAPHSQESA